MLTHPLSWLLFAALAIGTLRASLVPSGNYNIDESGHFLQITKLGHDILNCRNAPSCIFNLLFPSQQINDLPDTYRGILYYLPQSFVQLLLPQGISDDIQLFFARFLTLLLHLPAIVISYFTIRLAFPSSRLIAILIASFTALLPSYSDMMSGVNLEAPSALIGSLILYTASRIAVLGFTPLNISLALLSALLGYSLKGTVWITYIALALAIWFRLPSIRWRWFAALGGVLAMIVFGWQYNPLTTEGVSNWYYKHYHIAAVSVLPQQTSVLKREGNYSLLASHQIDNVRYEGEIKSVGIVQYFPESRMSTLRNKTITCGVWMRAFQEDVVIPYPTCGVPLPLTYSSSTALHLFSNEWTFYAAQIQIPPNASTVEFLLGLPLDLSQVVYNGMIMVEGEYPLNQLPTFFDASLKDGTWGGRTFTNLLKNPSAESTWWQVSPSYGYPYLLNSRIVAVLDWERTWTAWFALTRWLLANFWSSFGGLLPGLSSSQMIIPAIVTLFSTLGVALIIVWDIPRQRFPFHTYHARTSFWILVITTITFIALLLYRADIVPYLPEMFVWSSARHAAAGRTAISALLVFGFLRWIPRRHHRFAVAGSVIALFVLNIYILFNVQYPFQHCTLLVVTDCLSSIH
ncbi:MAG: hypothetical protein HZC38_16400 [Chloroflexi bacterium]|nr:hypothetical protein [Chloroflexota bacterium]